MIDHNERSTFPRVFHFTTDIRGSGLTPRIFAGMNPSDLLEMIDDASMIFDEAVKAHTRTNSC